MGKTIRRWFDRAKKPRQEFVAYAVMLSWHPGVGVGVLDPLAGRHFVHQPGTSIIKGLQPPTKLAADYFPVSLGQRAQLPRELTGKISVNHTVMEQQRDGYSVTIERYELSGALGQKPFVYQRAFHPEGHIEVEASYGQLKHTHSVRPEGPLVPYIQALKTLARRTTQAARVA